MNVMSKTQLRAAVAALVGAGGLYDTCKIGLFKNDVALNDHLLLADITPAAFTGYALSGAVTWSGVITNDAGAAESHSSLIHNACTAAPVTPEIIYGLYAVDNAGVVLLWVAKFDVPQVIADIGDAVLAVARFALDNGQLDLEPILS